MSNSLFNTSNNDEFSNQPVRKSRRGFDPGSDQFSFQSFIPVLGLVGVWLVVLIVEASFGGFKYSALDKWPIVVGDLSKLGLLNPLDTWARHESAQHFGMGILTTILVKFASTFAMVISSALAGFFHLSFVHLFIDSIYFLLISLVLIYIGISGSTIVRYWFLLSSMTISFVWLIAEFLVNIANWTDSPANVISEIGNSGVPVMGSSAGFFGLLGFAIFQMIRQFKFTIIRELIMIVLCVLALVLLYTVWNSIGSYNLLTANGSAALLAGLMHIFGFVFGSIRGLRYRLRSW